MAYITKSNASRIIKKVNLKDLPDLEGLIYKKEIYFFGWEGKRKILILIRKNLAWRQHCTHPHSKQI